MRRGRDGPAGRLYAVRLLHTSAAWGSLAGRRIRLRRFALLPAGRALQRLDGAGLFDVEDRVELLPEAGGGIVAQTLRLPGGDDPHRPLQTRPTHIAQ